jgi:hypothetical protein
MIKKVIKSFIQPAPGFLQLVRFYVCKEQL